MRTRWKLATLVSALAAGVVLTIAAGASASSIQISGSGSPQTGDIPQYTGAGLGPEFPGVEDADSPDAYSGTISLSNAPGNGVGVNSGPQAKSNPTLDTSFAGLNHYQQRYSRGGNQW